MWIAKDLGSTPVKITFQLATAITDDGEGGDASGTTALIIPVRLVPISGQNEVARVIERDFPGTSTYDYLFYAWVNDRKNYKVPKELRQQRQPVGECTLPDIGEGRVECAFGLVIEDAAKRIGEKFTVIWTGV